MACTQVRLGIIVGAMLLSGCSGRDPASAALTSAPVQLTASQSVRSDIERYAPIVLGFVAAWLTVGPIFTLLEKLHALRDKVVLGPELGKYELAPGLDIEYRTALLRNSYEPILYGWLFFFVTVFLFAIIIAATVGYWLFRLVSLAVAIQYLLTFLGFLKGGRKDIELMKSAIASLPRSADCSAAADK